MSVSGGDGAALDAGVVAQDGVPPADQSEAQRFALSAVDMAERVLASEQDALARQQQKLAVHDGQRTGIEEAIAECEAKVAAAQADLEQRRQAATDLGV